MHSFTIRVKDSFNKAENTYDTNSLIQQIVGNELIARLKVYKPVAKKIIDLGCGTGITTKQLANAYQPYSYFYAVDIADKLLAKAKERLRAEDIRMKETDFATFDFSNLFDMVFSNMALQWSTDLGSTLGNIYRNLSTYGVLAFSIPVAGTFKELKLFARLQLYQKKTIDKLLEANNFRILHTSFYNKTIKFNSLVSALKSIKSAGANCSKISTEQAVQAPVNQLLKSRKILEQPFSLTYKICLFIATKDKSVLCA